MNEFELVVFSSPYLLSMEGRQGGQRSLWPDIPVSPLGQFAAGEERPNDL